MKKNFTLSGSVRIESAEGTFDLHNDFTVAGIFADPATASLCLRMASCGAAERRLVEFNFKGVGYLELVCGDPFASVCDLQECGYKNPADRDLDWLISEEDAEPGDHLVFRFKGDAILRAHAAACQFCVVEED